MKRKFSALICGVLLLSAGAAHAEHKLLVTELLDAKQVEVQTGYEYSQLHTTLRNEGAFSKVDYGSRTTVGAGLGCGLQLDLSLRQVFQERDLEPSGVETHNGIGDLSAALSYRIRAAEKWHLALVTGLGIKFDSAGRGNAGSGTTDVSPYLAASYQLEGGYIPYASYRATLRNSGASDSHELTFGLEKEINKIVTLDCKGVASFGTGAAERSSAEDYTLEVGPYLNLGKNLYLIPSLAVLQQSRRTIGDIKEQSVAGIKTGLALYCYFD